MRAPESFNLISAKLDINAVLVPVHLPPAHLQDFVRAVFSARNIKGLLLTIPHKSLLILGAGGGAAIIAASLVSPASLASMGAAAEVALYDPAPGKAQMLANGSGRRRQAGLSAQTAMIRPALMWW